MNAIEELVESEAIRKLRVRYSHAFDGNRMDELVDLFTDDAVCEFGPDAGFREATYRSDVPLEHDLECRGRGSRLGLERVEGPRRGNRP